MNGANLSKLSYIYVVLLIETEEKALVQVWRELRKPKCRQLQFFFQPLLLDLKPSFVFWQSWQKKVQLWATVTNKCRVGVLFDRFEKAENIQTDGMEGSCYVSFPVCCSNMSCLALNVLNCRSSDFGVDLMLQCQTHFVVWCMKKWAFRWKPNPLRRT